MPTWKKVGYLWIRKGSNVRYTEEDKKNMEWNRKQMEKDKMNKKMPLIKHLKNGRVKMGGNIYHKVYDIDESTFLISEQEMKKATKRAMKYFKLDNKQDKIDINELETYLIRKGTHILYVETPKGKKFGITNTIPPKIIGVPKGNFWRSFPKIKPERVQHAIPHIMRSMILERGRK